MKTNIIFRGYILGDSKWLELSSEKLTFPKEILNNNPLDYIQELMKTSHIKYYLITYDELKVKE